MSNNRVCHFKLVLLGDSAVGKSCLVVRFVRDEFFEFQEPTIGGMDDMMILMSSLSLLFTTVLLIFTPLIKNPLLPTAAFLTQTVALDDATVKFEIWDTAGQERYRSLAPMYYR